MCDVQELRGRVCKERKGKGDTRRLGRHKEKQETARRLQVDTGDCKETARRLQGDCKETARRCRRLQGDAGDCKEDAGRRRETQGIK